MEKNLIKRLMDRDDPLSIKRFIVLLVSANFIFASFLILFICFYVIFYTTRGKVDKDLLSALKDILYYDVLIITGGLGLVGVENLGQAMVERAKAFAFDSSSTIRANSIENVNVDPTPVTDEPSIKDEPK